MDDKTLRTYAREGARMQLQNILKQFPELSNDVMSAPAPETPKPRKSFWTAARRRAQSRKLRAYHANKNA